MLDLRALPNVEAQGSDKNNAKSDRVKSASYSAIIVPNRKPIMPVCELRDKSLLQSSCLLGPYDDMILDVAMEGLGFDYAKISTRFMSAAIIYSFDFEFDSSA